MHKWEPTGSALVGVNIFSLVSNSSSSHCQLLAGTSIGLYCSEDNGKGWERYGEGLGSFPVMSAICVPNRPKGPTIMLGGAPGAVLCSRDGGQTWEWNGLDWADAVVTILAVSPSQDGLVLAGTAEDGIYCSTTNGNRWQAANFGLRDLQVWDLAISPVWESEHTAFAIAGDGLFRTTNSARGWKEVSASFLKGVAPQAIAISPDFAHDGMVFLGTDGQGVWRSSDRGDSWELLGGSYGMRVNCLLVSPNYDTNRSLYAGTVEDGVVRLRDARGSWEQLGLWNAGAVSCLTEAASKGVGLLFAGAQDRGVFRLVMTEGS